MMTPEAYVAKFSKRSPVQLRQLAERQEAMVCSAQSRVALYTATQDDRLVKMAQESLNWSSSVASALRAMVK